MGNNCSTKNPVGTAFTIRDKYETVTQIDNKFRAIGLESINLIFGIDATKSNQWTGKRTFGGKHLHAVEVGGLNFYERVISYLGSTLEKYDDDKLVPAYYFGDNMTTNKTVASLTADGSPCKGFGHVLECYRQVVPRLVMTGPTNFGPLIRKAIQIVSDTGQYHILVIVTDGEITDSEKEDTTRAIIEASNYPLSIVCIGVGDGPWDTMNTFDDDMKGKSLFDNFQFVDFNRHISDTDGFLVDVLQEIPDQYTAIQRNGLFRNCKSKAILIPLATVAPAISSCVVCQDREKDTALQPCGHMFCGVCARMFVGKPCPTCRATVARTQRVYS